MANQVSLEFLGIDESTTVAALYREVAGRADLAINGITEAMRNNVFRVRTVKRGGLLDLQRTSVRVGGVRFLPFTQESLLSRWAIIGGTHNGYPKGSLMLTEELLAGNARLNQFSPHNSVKATWQNNYIAKQSADFAPNLELGSLEIGRKEILLSAAKTIVSHSMAIEQINGGLDPVAVLATLQNPDVLSFSPIDQ